MYLFAHFREKRTPDGEQVHFALSRDGYNWESINEGRPVLWAMKGEKGVRDFALARGSDGVVRLLATDLSLSYSFMPVYGGKWPNIVRNGSNRLMMWESSDLVHWSKEQEVVLSPEGCGCHWAPDIVETDQGLFLISWSSPGPEDMEMCIWYALTRDFHTLTEPKLLYKKKGSSVIDSCIVKENGIYYLWVKSDKNPGGVMMLKSENPEGPYEPMPAFDAEMETLKGGTICYEAPVAVKSTDGAWLLMLDFFGVQGAGQGYVPFVSKDISSGVFKRSDAAFSFPYGFKHGGIIEISGEEYERIKAFDFEAEGYNRGW